VIAGPFAQADGREESPDSTTLKLLLAASLGEGQRAW